MRRTRGEPGSSSPPAPDDEGAAEAEPARPDVLDAGVPPQRQQPLRRVLRREAADAGPQESPDLAPPRRDRMACDRQPDAHVGLPRAAPDSLRDVELERRDGAAGPDDARELMQRRTRIVDVPQEVGEGEAVERG